MPSESGHSLRRQSKQSFNISWNWQCQGNEMTQLTWMVRAIKPWSALHPNAIKRRIDLENNKQARSVCVFAQIAVMASLQSLFVALFSVLILSEFSCSEAKKKKKGLRHFQKDPFRDMCRAALRNGSHKGLVNLQAFFDLRKVRMDHLKTLLFLTRLLF